MPARVSFALLALAIVAAYTLGLGNFPLTERSEARYAGVSWEMLVSGDYLTPRYNGIKHFHKPPLFYWLTAGSMRLFGAHEAAARLPCALAALATIGLTAWLASRPSMGCPRPWLAAASLATAPFFWEMGRIAVTDMLVTLLLLVSLTSAWLVLDSGSSTPRLLVFWGSLGLNFLCKGPVGPLLAAMVLIPYMLRAGGSWKAFRPHLGLALAGLIGLPWYLAVTSENPGLLAYFLKFQTADRVFTTVHRRGGPPWFYLPVLAGGFLPWTIWLVAALKPAIGNARVRDDRANPDLFLLLWILVPTLFFSLIGSKLPPYVLPLFPALAILSIRHLPPERGWRWISPAILLALVALAALAQTRWEFIARGAPYAQELRWSGIWLLASLAVGLAVTRGRGDSPIAVLLASMLGLLFISTAAFARLGHLSAQSMAKEIRRQAQGPFEVAIFQRYLFGLPFYLGQRVVQVQHDRETQFETGQEHRAFLFPDLGSYLPTFRRADKDRFLIVSVQDLSGLSSRLDEPVVYSDSRFVVYKHSAGQRRGRP